jgi:hypothetical protein
LGEGRNNMREKRLIIDGEPCDMNLYPDGPQTEADAIVVGGSLCPHLAKCQQDGYFETHQCVMLMATKAAREVVKGAGSFYSEMQQFCSQAPRQVKWIWSADRRQFRYLEGFDQVVEKVEQFAKQLLAGQIPVGSSFEDVIAHATTEGGAIDLRRIEELEGRCGTNGGRGCDVTSGPCSCGAWH